MQSRFNDRVTIVNITLVLEAALLLVTAFWIQLAQIDLLPLLHFSKKNLLIGLAAGLGIAFAGYVMLYAGKVFKNSLKWLSALRTIVVEEVAPLFANLTLWDIFLISAASGLCEEAFFRGVVQSQLGLVPTSVLFGFFHCPTPRHFSYGLWALAAGLFMGWLRDWTGSLWVPVIAHALSNFILIGSVRFFLKTPQEV